MEPINKVTSIITPLDKVNVDTDQIISKEFLKRIERTGFGEYLFYHWRYDTKGQRIKDFVLNDDRFKDSNILVAHENFGCGSSREHAPWAIVDYGFNVIIAPSFADIFYSNCTKNGILPIALEISEVEELLEKGMKDPFSIDVNLEDQTVTTEEGKVLTFSIDPYFKTMLINGWDEISITIQKEDYIKAYEEKMSS